MSPAPPHPPHRDLTQILGAAGEAQTRMRVDRGLTLLERYLAAHAAFLAWCRANNRYPVDDPRALCDRSG